jgi:KDO2-lipid IV(A) lauroyltransferase
MLSALKRNRVVYIMADPGTKKPADGMLFRFLGKDMTMPAGPAQLARQSRAPVLPVAIVAADPKWHFEILPPVELAPGSSLQSDVETLLRVSEHHILRHPQLWSWHHRRWRHHRLASGSRRT